MQVSRDGPRSINQPHVTQPEPPHPQLHPPPPQPSNHNHNLATMATTQQPPPRPP